MTHSLFSVAIGDCVDSIDVNFIAIDLAIAGTLHVTLLPDLCIGDGWLENQSPDAKNQTSNQETVKHSHISSIAELFPESVQAFQCWRVL